MKNCIICLLVVFLLISFHSTAQTRLPVGYPDRSQVLDVLPGFIHPPKGYGEVPFYWWQGDTLTHERLLWQLDQLKNKGIPSLQINYSHQDSGGVASSGLSNPSKPALYTDAWYRKTIDIDALDLKNRLEIDLGDLVSSAELFINGKSAGIRLSPPWKFNITPFVRQGEILNRSIFCT